MSVELSVDELTSRECFNRTPLQVYTLALCTFGLYVFYWLARNRRIAEANLGIKAMPYWRWIGLIVPIWNIFLYYGSFHIIGRSVRKNGVKPPASFGVQALCCNLCLGLYRLPDPNSIWGLTATVLIGSMHVSIWQAERDTTSSLAGRRAAKLTRWEYFILAVGGFLLTSSLIGNYFVDGAKPDFNSMCWLLTVFFIFGAYFYGEGRPTAINVLNEAQAVGDES